MKELGHTDLQRFVDTLRPDGEWAVLHVPVDARLRPSFPREPSCDPDVAANVTRRWREHFPNGMEMGDSKSAHLDPVR